MKHLIEHPITTKVNGFGLSVNLCALSASATIHFMQELTCFASASLRMTCFFENHWFVGEEEMAKTKIPGLAHSETAQLQSKLQQNFSLQRRVGCHTKCLESFVSSKCRSVCV